MDQDLIEFCKKLGEEYNILSVEEKNKIKNLIKEKYLRREVKIINFSIYEALDFSQSWGTNIPESWKWINDFIDNQSVIVFFNSGEGKDYIQLKNGNIFVDFYNISPVEEFYITDADTSFLLAYCHSQCLSTMGTAKNWLRNVLDSRREED